MSSESFGRRMTMIMLTMMMIGDGKGAFCQVCALVLSWLAKIVVYPDFGRRGRVEAGSLQIGRSDSALGQGVMLSSHTVSLSVD